MPVGGAAGASWARDPVAQEASLCRRDCPALPDAVSVQRETGLAFVVKGGCEARA